MALIRNTKEIVVGTGLVSKSDPNGYRDLRPSYLAYAKAKTDDQAKSITVNFYRSFYPVFAFPLREPAEREAVSIDKLLLRKLLEIQHGAITPAKVLAHIHDKS